MYRNALLACTFGLLTSALFLPTNASACVDGIIRVNPTLVETCPDENFESLFINWYKFPDLDQWEFSGGLFVCDFTLPYAKARSAAKVNEFGLPFTPQRRFGDVSYHGQRDYTWLSRGIGTQFHDFFKYVPTEASDLAGQYRRGDDETGLYCPLFDPTSTSSVHPFPSATMMHESLHAWEWSNGIALKQEGLNECSGHQCGPLGFCTQTNCDTFWNHPLTRYEYGDLYVTNEQGECPCPRLTEHLLHRPYQIAVEFLCDLAVDGIPPWITPAVQGSARGLALGLLNSRFVNPPPVVCAAPVAFNTPGFVAPTVSSAPPTSAPSGCQFSVGCGDVVSVTSCVPNALSGEALMLQRLDNGTPTTVATDTQVGFPGHIFVPLTDHPKGNSVTYRVCDTNAFGPKCTAPQTLTLPHTPCGACLPEMSACNGSVACCAPADDCRDGLCQLPEIK